MLNRMTSTTTTIPVLLAETYFWSRPLICQPAMFRLRVLINCQMILELINGQVAFGEIFLNKNVGLEDVLLPISSFDARQYSRSARFFLPSSFDAIVDPHRCHTNKFLRVKKKETRSTLKIFCERK